MKRIGIFSGTFDPVHKGHLAFALQAIESAKLDKVYFLPEAKPRRKVGVTHYSHRVAMLRLALKPYPKLKLLEVPDSQLSVTKTMPRLHGRFKNDQLFILLGSDAASHLVNSTEWPNADKVFKNFGVIVGLRSGAQKESVQVSLKSKAGTLGEIYVVASAHQESSSRLIRAAAAKGLKHRDLLKSLEPYVRANWLYAVAASAASGSDKRS